MTGTPGGRPLRVAALWRQSSAYTRACFGALQDLGVDLAVVCRHPTPDAPYDGDSLDVGAEVLKWSERPDEPRVRSMVEELRPDALLVVSWNVGAYRRVARAMRGRTLRVLVMDNAWLGTAKQWGGRAVAPWAIRPAYDVAFLPGERQAAFARRLGFGDDRILWGLYSADQPAMAAVGHAGRRSPPRTFLHVGRLAPEKGVDVLAAAYGRYRQMVAEPWPLVVCGTGPLAAALEGVPGVEMTGFVQPADLPAVYARAGCLVLASRFEPWGVAIHEAASAGLAVICTTACGASTRLVLDGFNGAVVGPGDAASLAAAMARVTRAPEAERVAMSERSALLATQLTPKRWARYLTERVVELRAELGLTRPPPPGRPHGEA